MSKHKHLTDKGWKNMNTLLDRELPQQDKKRDRMGWLFMILILAILAGWLGTHLAQRNRPQAQQQTPDGRTPAQAANPTPRPPSTSDNTPSTYTNTPSQALPTLSIGLSKPTFSTPTSIALPNAAAAQPAAFNHSPIQETELNILRYTPIFWPKGIESPTAQFAAAHQLPPSATPLLPTAALLPLHNDHTGTAAVEPIKKQKEKVRYFNWSLLAGINLFQVKKEPGLVLGTTLDLSTSHSKFGLQSGLLYRYQQFAGESRPTVPVTYDSYLKATGNRDVVPRPLPNSWVSVTSTNRVIIPVMATHQLEVPLMLFYKATPRFRLLAGMTFLRNVWIESANKGLITYDLKVVTTPNDDAQGNLNNIITGQLPQWEKNWQTGIAFQPIRRLELGLYYRSTWNGTPALSNFNELFNTCHTCDSKYPKARENTLSSIRPFSLQFNVHYKF